jgi:hypothetical protein
MKTTGQSNTQIQKVMLFTGLCGASLRAFLKKLEHTEKILAGGVLHKVFICLAE